jgi:hypothetical protein
MDGDDARETPLTEFLGHKVNRRHANIFVESFSDGEAAVAHHQLDGPGRGDGWTFEDMGETVMLSLIEGEVMTYYPLANVRRIFVLPRLALCEYDSEPVELSAPGVVHEGGHTFHDVACASRWKEESNAEDP